MKDLGFTETQQAIRSTIREYLEREVEPLVAEMEAERLLPYVPIRRMLGALGFGANLPATSLDGDGRAIIRQAARALASCSHTRNRRTTLTYSRGFSFIVR